MTTFIIGNTSDAYKNLLNFLSGLSGAWKVEIKKHNKKRSTDQNALYWSWLTIIGSDLGYSSEELHEALKAKILGVVERKTIFGNTVNEPRSTTTLTTKEFTDYLNAVQSFAMSLGITLPQPDYYGITTGGQTE